MPEVNAEQWTEEQRAAAEAAAEAAAPRGAPHVDHAPENLDEVQSLSEQFKEYRAEIASLRQEIRDSNRPRGVPAPVDIPSEEERQEARFVEIRKHSHYCPGCGRLSTYMRECTGLPGGAPGHPPIDMVSTDELLSGDPSQHTHAPEIAA